MSDPEKLEKPKKPISDKQLAANRANAKLSTGPRTEEGRAISRFNNLQHGMRSTFDVLPGEDADELARRHESWVEALAPQTEPELVAVQRAVTASWKLERGDRAENARARQAIKDATEGAHQRQAEEVAELAPRLAEDCGAVVCQLKKTPAGCAWLVEQWEILDRQLDQHGALFFSQRHHALHLLGKRMSDVFRDDPVVIQWLVVQTGASADRGCAQEMLENVCRTLRPEGMNPAEYGCRLKDLLAMIPEKAQARGMLRGLVAGALAAARERLELVELASANDRALAAEVALVDVSAEGQRLLSYVMSQDRSLHAALRRLEALQKPKRPGRGSGIGGEASANSRPENDPASGREPRAAAAAPVDRLAASHAPIARPAAAISTTEPIPASTPAARPAGAISTTEPIPPRAPAPAAAGANDFLTTEPIPPAAAAVASAARRFSSTDDPDFPDTGSMEDVERYSPDVARLMRVSEQIDATYGSKRKDTTPASQGTRPGGAFGLVVLLAALVAGGTARTAGTGREPFDRSAPARAALGTNEPILDPGGRDESPDQEPGPRRPNPIGDFPCERGGAPAGGSGSLRGPDHVPRTWAWQRQEDPFGWRRVPENPGELSRTSAPVSERQDPSDTLSLTSQCLLRPASPVIMWWRSARSPQKSPRACLRTRLAASWDIVWGTSCWPRTRNTPTAASTRQA